MDTLAVILHDDIVAVPVNVSWKVLFIFILSGKESDYEGSVTLELYFFDRWNSCGTPVRNADFL